MPVVGGGSEQLAALGVRLKEAGIVGARRDMLRGIKSGAAPCVAAVKAAAEAKLPHGGGLNVQVAGQKVSVSVRTGARTAGVRMTTTAPDTSQTDSGYVRHPVFGNRKKWITQQIPAAKGWWSTTLKESVPMVQPFIEAAMKDTAERIQRGI